MNEAAGKTDDFLSWAWMEFRSGNRAEAIRQLEAHLDESPDDKDAATLLGRLYLKDKQPYNSSVWLKHALRIGNQPRTSVPQPAETEDLDETVTLEDFELYAGNEPNQHETESAANYDFQTETEFEYAPTQPSPPQGTPTDQAEERSDDTPHIPRDPAEDTASEQDPDHEDLDDLFDLIEEPTTDDSPSWQDQIILEDETSEEELEDPGDSTTASLTYEDKAKQEAARIGAEAGWDRSEIDPLIEILSHHRCHAKTIGAMRALIRDEAVTPGELRLLQELRAIWVSHGYNRVYWGDSTGEGWQNLSWQMGLALTRTLNSDHSEEVLIFFEDAFEDWSSDSSLITLFPNFRYYLLDVLNTFTPEEPWWLQQMPKRDVYEVYSSKQATEILNIPAYKLLEEYGLLENQGGIESPLEG